MLAEISGVNRAVEPPVSVVVPQMMSRIAEIDPDSENRVGRRFFHFIASNNRGGDDNDHRAEAKEEVTGA